MALTFINISPRKIISSNAGTVSVLGYITSFKKHVVWDCHEKSYEWLMHIVFLTVCFNNVYVSLLFICCL